MCSLDDIKKQNKDDHQAIMSEIGLIKEKVNSAGSFSRTMKWGIGLAVLIIMYLLKVGNNYQEKSYQLVVESEGAKIEAYKMIDSINTKMNAFVGNSIMDTLQGVRKDIHQFYTGEWVEEKTWTKQVYDNEIHPNTVARKRGELLLKDHELRISKLERELQ